MPKKPRKPIILAPGKGRRYDMGAIQSVFKADNQETASAYSVSEWWIDAKKTGPGKHKHPEDDLFFVIEGTMSFFIKNRWIDAPKGSFVLVPAGVLHDFENRSSKRAGVLNFSAPGGFEDNMSMIADWYAENPPKDIRR